MAFRSPRLAPWATFCCPCRGKTRGIAAAKGRALWQIQRPARRDFMPKDFLKGARDAYDVVVIGSGATAVTCTPSVTWPTSSTALITGLLLTCSTIPVCTYAR